MEREEAVVVWPTKNVSASWPAACRRSRGPVAVGRRVARAVVLSVIAAAASTAARLAHAEQPRMQLLEDFSVAITAADGATAVFAPRFVVLRAASDPKLQIRGATPGGVNYNLTTWGTDDQPAADPSLQVPDGADPILDQAFGAGRTADLFRASPAATVVAEAADQASGDRIAWRFPSTDSFALEAELTLPAGSRFPLLRWQLSVTTPGFYSVGYVGAPTASIEQAEEWWQPLIWNEKRLPDQSVLTQAFRCPLPTALVTSAGVTTGVVADPSEFPFMPLPTFRQNNPFGVALRTPEGTPRAMLFAPVLGGEGSQMEASDTRRFSARLAVVRGDADTAFEQIARTLYGFGDQRSNDMVSLNTTLENMIAYGLSEWSAFDEDLRGCTYSTDVPGAVKNVSSLHPLSVALVTDDPEIFTARGLPMVEYMLSREKFLFATSPEIKIQNPTWLLGGPCCPLSELAALSSIAGGRGKPLMELAVREYGRDRVFNLDATTQGTRWQNALALARATNDPAWQAQAIELADAYLARRTEQPQTDFSDPDAEGMFFWPSWVPQWIELFELYETTGEQRYLDAAVAGARDYAMFTWMCPAVPRQQITVDQSGKAPRYRDGDRYQDIPVSPSTVDAWRLSAMGLTPEASGTSKGHRGIFNAHYAPFMLRLAAVTGDQLLHDVARNAIIGRSQNFPGYHINTDRSLVYATADFPLRPQRQLNATSSIHYNHVWPHIALLVDYLVSDTFFRSRGAIDFPSQYAEGYAYLQSRVYGDRPGTFYGDDDVWLWMPRGLLTIADTVELNAITGRGPGTLYIALTNQSSEPQRARVQIAAERVRLAGRRTARVWRDNLVAEPVQVADGCCEISVAPGGITALAIPHDGLTTTWQHTFASAGRSWEKGHEQLTFGGLEAWLLEFGEAHTSAYVSLRASDRVLKEVVLKWRSESQGPWHELRDDAYPFEFRIPLDASVNAVEFFVDVTRVNGQHDRSPTGRLHR